MYRSVISLCLLLICSTAVQQQGPPLEPRKLSDFDQAKPTGCDDRNAVLDVITQKTPADQSIIVVARQGTGETRSDLSWRRLENVRAYWTKFLLPAGRRDPKTIILAQGEKVEGYGQLEFYAGGNLVEVIKVARNADLFIGTCIDEKFIRHGTYDPCELKSDRIFYPCRDRKTRRNSGQ
jgi:hypothetical protein